MTIGSTAKEDKLGDEKVEHLEKQDSPSVLMIVLVQLDGTDPKKCVEIGV